MMKVRPLWSAVRSVAAAVAISARNAQVRRAELAWGGSIAAEWAHFVALGLFAFEAGGTAAVGIAGLIRLLPAAILTPFAASLGEDVRRERVFLVAAGVGTLALAGSALGAWAGAPGAVYALAAVVGIATTLIRPTLSALLPTLARTPQELVAANGATLTFESFGGLAGPLLAGGLATVAPSWVLFAAAAVPFVLALVSVAGLDVPAPVPLAASPVSAGRPRNPISKVRSVTAEVPGTRTVLALVGTQTLIRGCLNVLIVVTVFDLLHTGSGTVGVLTAAFGAGGLVGALWAMTLNGRRLTVLFVGSLVGWGAPIVLLGLGPGLPASFLLICVVGAANSVEDVTALTLLQRAFPDGSINSVLGMLWGLATGAIAVGSAVTPALADLVGVRPTFFLVGALLPVVGLAGHRALRRLDSLSAPGEQLGLLDAVPIFAPLSLAAKERLARALTGLDVPAGTPVVTAGEVGDRFYVVAAGSLQVSVGARVKPIEGGDYFGEIALLRAVPRTATVTAVSDCRLYALAGADFVAAVTVHPAAERAAQQVADDRLAADRPPPSELDRA